MTLLFVDSHVISPLDAMNEPIMDFFDHIPSKEEKIEMRKASKSPSEWLTLLCRDWAIENEDIVNGTDYKFIAYKSYLKGRLSSQLLCRLSIPEIPIDAESTSSSVSNRHIDFWGVLGVQDDFDKSYIVSQIERFCAMYSIRAIVVEDDSIDQSLDTAEADTSIIMSHSVVGGGSVQNPTSYLHGMNSVKDPRYVATDQRDTKRKVTDRAEREASREEKRQKKLKLRQNREHAIRQQKEAALARAEELVKSNKVPIEITRGAACASAAVAMMGVKPDDKEETATQKRQRSAIVVSTASDLDRIVTHAKNLYKKYNAIAKEHDQKINWSIVAKELGVHVKVREKYSRMHARAIQRGFDFKTCGHLKIKEHPHIFLEPLAPQQKLKLNVVVNPKPTYDDDNKNGNNDKTLVYSHKDLCDEQDQISDYHVAAAVDAAIKTVPGPNVNCYDDAEVTVDKVMNASVDIEVDLSVSNATQAALAVGSEHVVMNTENVVDTEHGVNNTDQVEL